MLLFSYTNELFEDNCKSMKILVQAFYFFASDFSNFFSPFEEMKLNQVDFLMFYLKAINLHLI
jgi:hypothetical protein